MHYRLPDPHVTQQISFQKGICRFILLPLILFCAMVLPVSQAVAGEEQRLDFTLPVPTQENHQAYLGLSGKKNFSLAQIKADIVMIEVFSMYCPICQREAKNVNALYDLLQKRDDLKNRVKLIGIGAGNSAFEVNFFREKYGIEFPLFSDADFVIHKKIGEVRTPHFFGLSLTGGGKFKVFYSKSGEVSDPERFLEKFLKTSEEAK